METAPPFTPETRRSDRLRFAFVPRKGGKRPGFTDPTGEYRDTRTGWLGREDSNLRLPESKSGALPLGYAPIDARSGLRVSRTLSGTTIGAVKRIYGTARCFSRYRARPKFR